MTVSKGKIATGAAAAVVAYEFGGDVLDALPIDDDTVALALKATVAVAAIVAGWIMVAKENAVAGYGGAVLLGAGIGLGLDCLSDLLGFAE